MRTDIHTRIGSLTKTFTITALLMLIDQGRLRRDDPIAKLIPGVPSGAQIPLHKPVQSPPGTQFHYCNTNTVLLGLAVEQVSGQRLADYVDRNILAPVGLTHTSIPTTPTIPDPHPQGYTVTDGVGAFDSGGCIGHSGVTPGLPDNRRGLPGGTDHAGDPRRHRGSHTRPAPRSPGPHRDHHA